MVELMWAIFVLALIMGAVAAAMASALRVSRGNTNRVIAANIAAEQMDQIRENASQDFDTVEALFGGTSATRTVKNVTYSITRSAGWVGSSSSASPCDGGSALNAYVRLTVEVSWSPLQGVKPVKSQTVIAPPVAEYDPNTGNAAVKVLDAAGRPKTGIQVTLGGGPSGTQPTQYTSSEGCAFFAFLDPGTYTATINATGHADLQGIQTPTKSLGVNVATTTPFPFTYDLLGSLEVTLRPVRDSSGPVYSGFLPVGTPVTLHNTGLQPTGIRVVPGSGPVRTIPSLFPFTSGYAVWAGECDDADPDLYGTNLRAPAIPVGAGDTGTGDVALPTIRLHVEDASGIDQPGQTVQLIHAADPGCATGQVLTYEPSAVTDSDGEIEIAAPYGAWTIEVDGRSPLGAWPTVTLSPLDAEPRPEIDVDVQV